MSNSDRSLSRQKQLRAELDQARTAGQWLPWACATLALAWWGGAIAYLMGKIGMAGLQSLPPAELGGGLALGFAPGLALIVSGFMARESARSSHANAIVLSAAQDLLSPAEQYETELQSLGASIATHADSINDTLNETEARVQVLRQDIEESANAAMKAAEIVRADADALKQKLGTERAELSNLSDSIRKQTEALTNAVPLHTEKMSRASEMAMQEVKRANKSLDERLNAIEETGKSLSARIAQLDQMTADSRKRAQNLVSSLMTINEQLLGSSRTVDSAVKAGDLAVEASRTTADAMREVMDSALDGARDSTERLQSQAKLARQEAESAIQRLTEAAAQSEATIKGAMIAARTQAEETEKRMDKMSEHMFHAAQRATQAAEAGLERARARIERASQLLNGVTSDTTDSPAHAAPINPPPSSRMRDPADDMLEPEAPIRRADHAPSAAPRVNAAPPKPALDLTPFDPLEPETPQAAPPQPPPRIHTRPNLNKPTASSEPGSAIAAAAEAAQAHMNTALPTSAARPAPAPPAPPAPMASPVQGNSARPQPSAPPPAPAPGMGAPDLGGADMTWRDLLSNIDQPDAQHQTALAFVAQLDRAGIRLKRAIRSTDLRRIAAATARGERQRRRATKQAAPGELNQIQRLLQQDEDLRIAAESYLSIEEPEALKFLEGAERAREDAGPRLAAYLLLDAALS